MPSSSSATRRAAASRSKKGLDMGNSALEEIALGGLEDPEIAQQEGNRQHHDLDQQAAADDEGFQVLLPAQFGDQRVDVKAIRHAEDEDESDDRPVEDGELLLIGVLRLEIEKAPQHQQADHRKKSNQGA